MILSAALAAAGTEQMKWDASNDFGAWGKPVRMTLQRKNGILVIHSRNNDPCFQLDKLTINPRAYNLFVIEYRTPETIPSGNQGKSISSGVYIDLGSYICDGQWHRKEIPLTSANIFPFKYWEKASGIRKLRFDPFEGKGALEIRSMEFFKDNRRAEAAVSAEQRQLKIRPEDLEITPFVASIGQGIKPLPADFDYEKAKEE